MMPAPYTYNGAVGGEAEGVFKYLTHTIKAKCTFALKGMDLLPFSPFLWVVVVFSFVTSRSMFLKPEGLDSKIKILLHPICLH